MFLADARHTNAMLTVFFNSIILYFSLVILLRLTGKRQLGELEITELIVTILISEVAAAPLVDPNASIPQALVPIATLLGLEVLMSFLSLKSKKIRELTSGKPALLVVRGQADRRQMQKNRITFDELGEAMRGQGLTDLGDVEFAVLETDGSISILPQQEKKSS